VARPIKVGLSLFGKSKKIYYIKRMSKKIVIIGAGVAGINAVTKYLL